MGKWHIVCRTCATEGIPGPHETILDKATEPGAKGYANLHRKEWTDHDVHLAEVE